MYSMGPFALNLTQRVVSCKWIWEILHCTRDRQIKLNILAMKFLNLSTNKLTCPIRVLLSIFFFLHFQSVDWSSNEIFLHSSLSKAITINSLYEPVPISREISYPLLSSLRDCHPRAMCSGIYTFSFVTRSVRFHYVVPEFTFCFPSVCIYIYICARQWCAHRQGYYYW